ncbi:MAG: UrcA family protein [Candidatus Pseudothioglobus sp.]|jgi:UrcA family protein
MYVGLTKHSPYLFTSNENFELVLLGSESFHFTLFSLSRFHIGIIFCLCHLASEVSLPTKAFRRTIMKNRQALAALLLTTTMASGAMANTLEIGSQVKQAITINYADLNVTGEAGAKVLYRRIQKAASKLCGITAGIAPIGVRVEQKSCVNGTVTAAVERLDSVLVEQLHRS